MTTTTACNACCTAPIDTKSVYKLNANTTERKFTSHCIG